MDDKDPYPALLGIDWAFDHNAIYLQFETEELRVVTPLYLTEA